MTMGPPQAKEALGECLALGAHRLRAALRPHVRARRRTRSGPRERSHWRSRRRAPTSCSAGARRSTRDLAVPPEVAASLGWPQLTAATALEASDGRLRVTRQTDRGEDVYELELPAVVSIAATAARARRAADGPVRCGRRKTSRPTSRRTWRFGRGVADAGARRPRRHARARGMSEPARSTTPGHGDPSAPRGANAGAGAVGEARAHRRAQGGRTTPGPGRARGRRPTRHSLELVGRCRAPGRQARWRERRASCSATTSRPRRTRTPEGCEPRSSRSTTDGWRGVRAGAAGRRPSARSSSATGSHVLRFPATAMGRDLGPRLAVDLELGMTGDWSPGTSSRRPAACCTEADVRREHRLRDQRAGEPAAQPPCARA